MEMLLLAGIFLPLFPLSIAFNGALRVLRLPVLRALLLLVWPQFGVWLLTLSGHGVPEYFVLWALASALFYALRLLTTRDLGMWAGFLASSALALTWGMAARGADALDLHLFVFWFSLPPALLLLLAGTLTQRFGAAYAGLQTGLARRLPRVAGVLALLVLAAMAMPLYPGFFAMLHLVKGFTAEAAIAALVVWLLWSWAGSRLLGGLIFGPRNGEPAADLGFVSLLLYLAVLTAFVAVGIHLIGGGL